MNLALIGYGKMGKEVEAVAKEKGITIAAVFEVEDNAGGKGLTRHALRDVDVCVDFSTPAAVLENINAVALAGKNIVVGTTGWYDRLEDVRTIVKKNHIGLLYASNFSLGVNLFMKIVENAGRLFDAYADYDVAVHETHHNKKSDSPSGTALSLASIIMRQVHRKTEILSDASHGQIKPHQLHVTSTRVGGVAGRHTILFDSECDAIELIHTAKNRRGFALGAVVAAEWLKGKKGVFTMKDVLLPT
jgi:4-hydroxy-tetrahydrodipicolinate reductase